MYVELPSRRYTDKTNAFGGINNAEVRGYDPIFAGMAQVPGSPTENASFTNVTDDISMSILHPKNSR